MKGQITRRLRWSDAALTLAPALLWYVAVHARDWVIHPYCAQDPSRCRAASLWILDQPAVGLELAHADGVSFTTQGLAAVVALALPLLWHLCSVLLHKTGLRTAAIAAATDFVIFAQTTFWNGLLTECARLLSQRPRPFVYADPSRAADASNYTSFYSGHTSFAAAATTYAVLTLWARGARPWALAIATAGAYAITSLTGIFRVLAGRHFPTDVLMGALAGFVVALVIARRHHQGTASNTVLP
jgi:membrane-associated phospholipid phosphatase